MSESEASSSDPQKSSGSKNIYQKFIEEYYAKRGHYTVAPDTPRIKERLAQREQKRGWKADMPVHPKEEETSGDLTDQVAKESKDSTASSHDVHKEGGKAHVLDHHAAPGPVISEDIGKPASKEELKARAAELNK